MALPPSGMYIISHTLHTKNDQGDAIFLSSSHKTLVELLPLKIVDHVPVQVIWEVSARIHEGHRVYTLSTIVPIIKDGIEIKSTVWLDVQGHSLCPGADAAIDSSHNSDGNKYTFQLWLITRTTNKFV